MSLLDTASLIVTPNGYKEGKLYSVIPSDGSGDMSVTRATTATRVNSQGLVELVPYNYVQYSQEFSNSSFWSYFASSVTANTTTAPDGTLTAETVTLSGTNGSTYQSVNGLNASVHTISAYFKKTNEDNVYIDCSTSGGYFGSSFNLTTLATSIFGGGFSPVIENVGNGWYRCSVQGFASGNGAFGFGVFAGSGQSAFLWGAQLVEGSSALPYQKTETRLNIPRLDYSNGTCPSILVEPQRTNLITYSEQFNQWSPQAIGTASLPVVTANAATAPNGLQVADKIVFNSGSGTGAFDWSFIISNSFSTSAASYTGSIYLKGENGGEQIQIRHAASGSYTKLTLTTEWQRFDTIETGTGGSANMELAIRRDLNEPMNATATIYAWAAQEELGSYATSYIPTTSASVTRNADVISKTGISSLIGQTEGTLFWDVQKQLGENDVRLNLSDDTTNNWLFVGVEFNNQPRIYCNVGGANQFSIYGAQVSNDFHKIAFAYKANDFVLYIDGVQVISHTSGSVPTCSRLDLGAPFPNGGAFATSQNKAVALWQTRLTNTQLAQLTTI